MSLMKSSDLRFAALILTIASLGAIALSISTVWGPGLREDSFSYITAAESFAKGTGLGRWAADGTFRPLTHFPPLLPLILAALRRIGLDFVESARYLNLGLFFITIALVARGILLLSHSKTAAAIGAVLTATSPVLIQEYSWAQSEPLFLSLGLAGLMFLASFLQRRQWQYLVIGSIIMGMAFFTRFAGIALILSSAIVCLYLPWASLKQRIFSSGIFLSLSSLPTALFLIMNQYKYGNLVDRPQPSWHPPDPASWIQGVDTISNWLFPSRILAAIPQFTILVSILVPILFVVLLLILLSKRTNGDLQLPRNPDLALLYLLITNFLGYALLILATVLFLDRLTPLNDRILSWLYISLLIFLIAAASRWFSIKPSSRWKTLITLTLFIIAGTQSARGVIRVKNLHQLGLGLSSPGWHNSETIAALASFEDVPIYTNDIPAVYFYTGRMAAFIPIQENPADDEVREDYAEQILQMHQELRNSRGVLVLFGSEIGTRLHSSNLEDLTKGLILFGEFPDGQIFTTSAGD